MSRPNPHALSTALDVETQRRDALAAQLAEAMAEREGCQAQLNQLEQYGRDTAAGFARDGAVHGAARLRHQQPFLDRLAQATAVQGELIARAGQRVHELQAALVLANQRRAAIEALIERNRERERLQEERRQQRQADEAAALRVVHRQHDTQQP